MKELHTITALTAAEVMLHSPQGAQINSSLRAVGRGLPRQRQAFQVKHACDLDLRTCSCADRGGGSYFKLLILQEAMGNDHFHVRRHVILSAHWLGV